ncbi:MAG: EscU/YscU/HrcU family type III secretion system export apparatus switch protein [Acidobacteria bacterium]|nr:EscU/YscU/HrcU family type III secretion system export apparatus switch protein [Acidobacteriota bacterium]
MSSSTGEKTEQPTDKRLQDARKKGQVAKSQDLTSAALLISTVAVVWLIGGYIGGTLQGMVRDQIEFAATFKGPFTGETAYLVIWRGLTAMVWALVPVFAVVVVFAFLGNYLQIGTIFSFESIAPKFDKLNPVEGFRNKFLKSRPYIELGKTLLKMAITAAVAGYVLWAAREDVIRLISKPPGIVAAYTFGLVLEIGLKIGLAFLILGGADFFLQRFLHRQEMKMTKHEVKEEYKETEGNPLIKAQRRALHREILSQSMAAAVRDADVVLANPTHVAVALKYERGKSEAPVITAKGADLMAAQIRRIAGDAGIPIRHDVPLARALYEFEVDQEIPEELYEAVAVVLQWVYALAEERGEVAAV